MKVYVSREKILLILDWCVRKFGKSKYQKKKIKLRIYRTKGISLDTTKIGRYGDYGDATISIFLGHEMTIRFLCKVVCHEYKHYLLSEDDWKLKYKILKKQLKKSGLSDDEIVDIHPHEEIAIRFENKWGNVCFNELKNKLYKK